MKQRFNYEDYRKLSVLPFEDKVCRAYELIQTELKQSKKPLVSSSWGKDSIVLLHLVREFCKDVAICFHNTGVQYIETYQYRDFMLKEWDIKNYFETKPKISFWECVRKYGYPRFRRMGRGKRGQKDNRGRDGAKSPRCCYHLKEKPAIDFIKQNNIDLEFVGLQASESMVRRLSFFREGEVFDSKKYGCRIVRPLMIWTDEDIWRYHKDFNIPINPIYKKMKRNGCMPCTGFKTWREVLAKTNPKTYAFISKDMGQPLLSEYCGDNK